jgi:1-acyl-sn-glycerol-3-phosphate acyltransferase
VAQVIPIDRARPRREPARCQALTAAGRPCRNIANANGFCRVHQPPGPAERIGPFQAERVREALSALRRRLMGDYHVDEFGFDPEFTERLLLPLVKPLYEYYWRAEWFGVDHVPDQGGAVLVANHGGALPLDALVMKLGILDRHPAHRHVRLLAADLAFRLPFVAPLTRKMGSTLACDEDALHLLKAGEVVGVFPEGYRGLGKGWRNRYKLQRFGRGGFVEIALRAGVPLLPVAIVGSEEIYPMLANAKLLARVGGFPYFPITATFPWLGPLGLIPLPSKWVVEVGEPIPTEGFGPDAHRDTMLVFDLADRVRDTIQQMLFQNLMKRGSAFLQRPFKGI